ncbi:hypothetical protein HZH66_010181 [Vespula vulgaris]|uniref:Uncharacterized protein n=1 Tax=Vespula vulgaris TaxID=7454 RepID=A0A834MZ36_VESVU|nr:hypothetical protein HZH66_010181 [Vespula vulgaris]
MAPLVARNGGRTSPSLIKSVAMVLHEMVIFYEANLDRGSSASLCPPLLTHTYRRLRCIIPHSKQHIAYPP